MGIAPRSLTLPTIPAGAMPTRFGLSFWSRGQNRQQGRERSCRCETRFCPPYNGATKRKAKSSRPLQRAAGLGYGGCCLVARNDRVDPKQVLRVARAFRLRLPDEGRGHELVIAAAVVDLVRLQLDFVRQLEIAQGVCELYRIERLFPICHQRETVHGSVAEPGA